MPTKRDQADKERRHDLPEMIRGTLAGPYPGICKAYPCRGRCDVPAGNPSHGIHLWRDTRDAMVAQTRDAGINLESTVIPSPNFWNNWDKYPFSVTK